MEYLLVQYPNSREVIVSNMQIGFTNEVIEIEGGIYEISLSGADDFSPSSQQVNLINTSELDPLMVTFSPVV